jgi:hypothetical protein
MADSVKIIIPLIYFRPEKSRLLSLKLAYRNLSTFQNYGLPQKSLGSLHTDPDYSKADSAEMEYCY